MSVDLKDFERQALQMPVKDRATLAEHLIASLDAPDDAECERLWVEEAERRYREYKRGRISSRSAEDVFRDAPSKIK
ncbi:addiction module protein [bacterium]|nr:addiction module protein [bacterium]